MRDEPSRSIFIEIKKSYNTIIYNDTEMIAFDEINENNLQRALDKILVTIKNG